MTISFLPAEFWGLVAIILVAALVAIIGLHLFFGIVDWGLSNSSANHADPWGLVVVMCLMVLGGAVVISAIITKSLPPLFAFAYFVALGGSVFTTIVCRFLNTFLPNVRYFLRRREPIE